ncbi:MAG: hypothetical protein ABI175_05040 [Polyangiales bacterium]
MRSSIVTSLLVATLASFVSVSVLGCAADAQHGDEEGSDAPSTVQADALSKLGKSIVGDYKSDAWYPRFSLAADRSYSWDTGIRCIKAPCPSGDAGTWTIYNGTAGSHYVNLVSKPAGQSRWFRIYDGPPVVLKGVFGTTGTFTKQGSTSYPTCESSKTKCEAGMHCEDTAIVCITTPCAPTAPSCVPDNKCATVRCAAGYKCEATGTTVGCVPLSKDYCDSDADCKIIDNYCGGCQCLPLANWATPPTCTDPVACFVQPCRGKTPACESNHCVAR